MSTLETTSNKLNLDLIDRLENRVIEMKWVWNMICWTMGRYKVRLSYANISREREICGIRIEFLVANFTMKGLEARKSCVWVKISNEHLVQGSLYKDSNYG